jgi:hypothetical protein
MQPSGQELESRRVCESLAFVLTQTGQEVPEWITIAAADYYGNVRRLDEATAMLCNECRCLQGTDRERILYDAHSKDSRRLADWFERHQEWDKRRVAEETESRRKIMLKDRAIQKLSVEERDALGL